MKFVLNWCTPSLKQRKIVANYGFKAHRQKDLMVGFFISIS